MQPGSAQPEAPWQYKPEATQQPAAPAPTAGVVADSGEEPAPVLQQAPEATWSASEFIDHNKGLNWYLSLGGLTLLVIVALFFFTHDFISITGVVIMAVLIGIVASRKPRVLEYHLDASGLTIGTAFHPYAEFKSFALIDEGTFSSIILAPLKRFLPPLSVYISAEDQDRIVEVLAQYLPMEMREHDAIDRLSRRIRF